MNVQAGGADLEKKKKRRKMACLDKGGSGAFDGLLRFPVNHSARCLSAAPPPISNAAGSQKGRLREQKATEEEEEKKAAKERLTGLA